MTLRELFTKLRANIPADIPQPDLVLREIAAKHLNLKSPTELIALDPNTELREEVVETIQSDVKKLIDSTPLSYLLGTAEFYGHTFTVTSDVLIPRPETEQLVELILQDLIRVSADQPIRLFEVGTGSGCIGTSLLYELNRQNKICSYTGIDISAPALEITKQNMENILNVQFTSTKEGYVCPASNFQIELIHADIADFESSQQFTHLISNPPYITTNEYEKLDKSVANFEPKLALEAGENGMSVYSSIAKLVEEQVFKPHIYLEISPTVAQSTKELFSSLYKNVEVRKDLFGRERFLTAS
jgi:release factor glutamine methyltransferase